MNLNKIFVNSNRWIKDGFARMKDGSAYQYTRQYKDTGPEPYYFSLQGAVCYYTDPDSSARQKVMARLGKAIERHTGKRMYVSEFNNSPDVSFDDLSQVIKIYSTIR
jgi:hypothetical protein